jgi:hypothetical protein
MKTNSELSIIRMSDETAKCATNKVWNKFLTEQQNANSVYLYPSTGDCEFFLEASTETVYNAEHQQSDNHTSELNRYCYY